MKFISVIKGVALSIWIWKFLITIMRYPLEIDIAFYPDYETPSHWVTISNWKRWRTRLFFICLLLLITFLTRAQGGMVGAYYTLGILAGIVFVVILNTETQK